MDQASAPNPVGAAATGVDAAMLQRIVAAVLADPAIRAALDARSEGAVAGQDSTDPPAAGAAS